MFAFLRGLDANAQSRETFVATGSINTERSFHTTTLLKDGRVLIINGSLRADAVGDHTLWALVAGKASNNVVLKIVSGPK